MADSARVSRRSPWAFIPTLYFAQGIPYVLVNTVSVIMYKKMGVSNEVIGLTSILYLPWVIKMLWGPLVDSFSTKRNWVLYTQLIMFAFLALVAFSMQMNAYLMISLGCFILAAFTSATHDIAADGFYMLSLDAKEQALFVGIRSTFFRLAMVFGSGLLVMLAGELESSLPIHTTWTVAFGLSSAIFLLVFIYHRFALPYPQTDRADRSAKDKLTFGEIFSSYFKQPKIAAIVIFILIYRLGEAVLIKMAAPFLLDDATKGGLGLPTTSVGFIYGTVGVLGLTFGGILGGWVIARVGLRKCVWPMAVILNLPHVVYIYMAWARPAIEWVGVLVGIEQFTYGFGFTALMVFMMYISKGPYKTSHFAISTGFMALGMMLPGFVSGYLQTMMGYLNFFILVICLTIPSMAVIFFIPLNEPEKAEAATVGH
jgi:MFS transporter, PAT family, beta-lactamase induction signal transducer AmpG